MEINIRPARLGDYSGLKRHIFTQSKASDIKKEVSRNLRKMKTGEVVQLVAECDGKIIGTCFFSQYESSICRHRGKIKSFAVAEEFQGRGVGSMLMEHGTRWLKKKGIKMLLLSVRKGTKAEKIYRHMGFKVYGELKNGLKETWGRQESFDEIFFYKKI